MTTPLPFRLESLRIATPCPADWDQLSGDARVRFCAGCEKNVYNLSAMTRGEAEALVREKEGRLCVRLYRRADGTVITVDCPVGTRRARLRRRVWASLSSVAASAGLVLGLLCGRARGDLTLPAGKKAGHAGVHLTGGAVAGTVAPPENVKLMGKVVLPRAPIPLQGHLVARPKPVTGESSVGVGDLAMEPSK